MYLMEQKADGRRFAATPNDVKSYSKALADAKAHFAREADCVALYLYNDDGSFIARTYTRGDHGEVGVLYGFHRFGATPPDLAPAPKPEEPAFVHQAETKTWTDECERVMWFSFDHKTGKTGLETYPETIKRLEKDLSWAKYRGGLFQQAWEAISTKLASAHEALKDEKAQHRRTSEHLSRVSSELSDLKNKLRHLGA